MAAIALALMSAVGAGDHLLMTDSAYHPARSFCDGMLKRMGVETTYYDPRLGAGDRVAVSPQHQGGVRRVAGLAVARGAGHSGNRRSRAWARRLRRRRQHLGDAAVLPATRPWRRSGDRGRHEISLRPFRPAARPGFGQRRLAQTAQAHRARAGDSPRPGRRLSRAARPAHDGAPAARSRATGPRARRVAAARAPRC